jgi:hypothetical protein
MNFCIVIPVYKEKLLFHEKISLFRINEIFTNVPKFLFFPQKLNIEQYISTIERINLQEFDPMYFKSIDSYNRLLKTSAFYKPILDFEYMLMYQLDSYIFDQDKIFDFLNCGYDYIGAPWLHLDWFDKSNKKIAKFKFLRSFINRVGNGGFSLRMIRTFYSFCLKFPYIGKFISIQEDIFWTNVASRFISGFNLPTIEKALEFSFDEYPVECFSLNNYNLPFGCHGWYKNDYDFWKKYIKLQL